MGQRGGGGGGADMARTLVLFLRFFFFSETGISASDNRNPTRG